MSSVRSPARHWVRSPAPLVGTGVPRRLGTVAVLAVVVLLATATAALAHPGFRPDEVPAGGPVEVELVIEHACAEDGGEPEEGEDVSPTVLVAMVNTDTFTILPRPLPGWSIVSEDDEVRWEATDGGEAGELVLAVVVEVVGEPGDDVPQPLYQECENGEFHRWSAAPGEDGDPQINLAVAEGTPPPLATPAPTAPPTPASTPIAPASPTPATSTAPASPTPSPSIAPSPSPSPSPSATPAAAATASASPSLSPTPSAQSTAAEEQDDEGGFNPAIWVAVFVAVFAGVAGVGLASRDRGDGPGDDEVTS